MHSKQRPQTYKHIRMNMHDHMDAGMNENMYYLYNQNSGKKNKIQTTGNLLVTQMEKVQHTKLQQTHKFLR